MPEADRPELHGKLDVNGLYDRTVAEHGVSSSRALCIPDHKTHVQRLQQASMFMHCMKDEGSVLDVGCGKGDLLNHTWLTYTGLEPCQALIEEARRRWPLDSFICSTLDHFAANDPLEAKFDIVASLGVMVTIPPAELGAFIKALKSLTRQYLLLSFIPHDTTYNGVFYTHPLEDVLALGDVLMIGEVAGEATVLFKVHP